jgi:quinol monooxygenase YgiN
MIIVLVQVRVKPEFIESFREATVENALNSRKEPGIARFDVIENIDDASRFTLIEAYRSQEATSAHKETAHYAKWRDTVAGMMAEPRTSVKYRPVSPDAGQWG